MYEVGGFSTARETVPRESEITPISLSTRTISIPALAREINDLSGWREFGTLSSQVRHSIALCVGSKLYLDEREQLAARVDSEPDDTRLMVPLRSLEKQIVDNLAHFWFTPSDRARLGLVMVRQQSKLEEKIERRHSRDERLEQEKLPRENGEI